MLVTGVVVSGFGMVRESVFAGLVSPTIVMQILGTTLCLLWQFFYYAFC